MKKKQYQLKPITKDRLYIFYSETETGGEICKGQENDSWPSYEDSYKSTTYKDLVRVRSNPTKKWPPEWNIGNYDNQYDEVTFTEDLSNIKDMYLVIVTYSDGGTFQTTHGYKYIALATSDLLKAKDKMKEILADSDSKYNFNRKEYQPWKGYFSSFEDVEIITREIKEW